MLQGKYPDLLQRARSQLLYVHGIDGANERGMGNLLDEDQVRELFNMDDISSNKSVMEMVSDKLQEVVDGNLRDGTDLADLLRGFPKFEELAEEMNERWDGDALMKYCVPADGHWSVWTIEKRAATSRQEFEQHGRKRQDPWDPSLKETVLELMITRPGNEQKFHVLGSTSLESLREKMYCMKDYGNEGAQRYHNWFLFVDGTFYVDFTYAESEHLKHRFVNLPLSILEHRELNPDKHQYQRYEIRSVKNVTFVDLFHRHGLDLSMTCVLAHQGFCEHTITISGIHLHGPYDPANEDLYPMPIFCSKVRRAMCILCQKRWARYACFNEMLTGSYPSKFCSDCFQMCFYDENNEILAKYENMLVKPYFTEHD